MDWCVCVYMCVSACVRMCVQERETDSDSGTVKVTTYITEGC